jgi:hypothetical protein
MLSSSCSTQIYDLLQPTQPRKMGKLFMQYLIHFNHFSIQINHNSGFLSIFFSSSTIIRFFSSFSLLDSPQKRAFLTDKLNPRNILTELTGCQNKLSLFIRPRWHSADRSIENEYSRVEMR